MDHLSQPPSESTSLALIPHPTVSRLAKSPAVANSRYGSEWNEDTQSEVSVLQYWRIVCHHKGPILLTAIGGLVLGFLACIPMTPVYRAKTSLEVLSFNDDFMNVKETNPVSANGNSTDASAEENQAKLLQSNSVLELVCAKLGYRKTFADSEPDLAATGWRH